MKNRIFFAITLVVLVLLCGCTQRLPGTDNNAGTDQNQQVPDQNGGTDQNHYLMPEQECNAKPTTVQRDLCLRDKAVLSKANIGFCDKLATLSRNDCLSRAGIALKDEETCGKISDLNIANRCYDSVAKDSNSYGACLKIVAGALRANCLATIGKSKNLIGACEEIPTTSHEFLLLRDDCIRTIAVSLKEPKLCELISASIVSQHMNKDECFWSIVQATKEKTLCTKIFDKNMVDNCVDFIARGDSNANYCLNIVDLNKQIACILSIAASASNASYCLLISDANESGNCKNSLLSKNTSISICSTFPDAAQRENCLYEYAKNFDANKCQAAIDANLSDNCITACRKIIIDEGMADNCFSDMAIKLAKVSYCYDIRSSNVYKRNDCFDAIATATLDASLCSNIFTRVETYSKCFANIAVKATDYSICDLAKRDYFGEDYSSKNWCIYYYAKQRNVVGDCNMIKDPNLLKECITDVGG